MWEDTTSDEGNDESGAGSDNEGGSGDASASHHPEVIRFVSDLKASPEMQAEFSQIATNLDSVVEYAHGKGYTFDHADAKQYLSSELGHSLTEEEEQRIAGGKGSVQANTNVETNAEAAVNAVAAENAAAAVNAAGVVEAVAAAVVVLT